MHVRQKINKTPVKFASSGLEESSEVSQWNALDPTSGDRLRDKIVNFVSDRKNRSSAIQATKPRTRRHGGGYEPSQIHVRPMESPSGKDRAKLIAEQLYETRGKIKLTK